MLHLHRNHFETSSIPLVITVHLPTWTFRPIEIMGFLLQNVQSNGKCDCTSRHRLTEYGMDSTSIPYKSIIISEMIVFHHVYSGNRISTPRWILIECNFFISCRKEASWMWDLQQGLQTQTPPNRAHAPALRRKAVPVWQVRQTLLPLRLLLATHEPQILLL